MRWHEAQRTLAGKLRKWARELGARPRVLAAVASGGAIALAGLGIWSCESTPKSQRPPIPQTVREPDVRVRIRNNVETVRLDGAAEVVLRSGGSASLVLPTPVTLVATDEGLRVIEKSGKAQMLSWPVEAAANHALSAGATGKSAFVRVDDWVAGKNQWERGHSYAGNLRLVLKGPGSASVPQAQPRAVLGMDAPAAQQGSPARMEIIETLPLERYLGGVLPAELPAGGPQAFHPTAFHVQAVCARSYALHQRARAQRLGRHFDLEAGESDQAYIGAPEIAVALKGIEETRGVVLTSQGQVLRAYYSSTCGGRPGSAAKVWPTGPGWEFNLAAPLQSHKREHACQHSPAYAWTQTRDLTEMSTRIREWGKANGHAVRGLKTIAALAVDEEVVSGRPSRFVLRDNTGATFAITSELLRNACNYNAAGVPPVTRETRIRSGDMEMEVQGSKVTIRGRGFGHGVGMCQYCIDGFAKRGESWGTIVLRFYPGAKLERAY